jgi:hypothetical protein
VPDDVRDDDCLDRELARTYDRLRALRDVPGRTAEAAALLQSAVDLAEARVARINAGPFGDAAADLRRLRIVLLTLARVRWREGRVCASLALAFRATFAGLRTRMRTWQSTTRLGGH